MCVCVCCALHVAFLCLLFFDVQPPPSSTPAGGAAASSAARGGVGSGAGGGSRRTSALLTASVKGIVTGSKKVLNVLKTKPPPEPVVVPVAELTSGDIAADATKRPAAHAFVAHQKQAILRLSQKNDAVIKR